MYSIDFIHSSGGGSDGDEIVVTTRKRLLDEDDEIKDIGNVTAHQNKLLLKMLPLYNFKTFWFTYLLNRPWWVIM